MKVSCSEIRHCAKHQNVIADSPYRFISVSADIFSNENIQLYIRLIVLKSPGTGLWKWFFDIFSMLRWTKRRHLFTLAILPTAGHVNGLNTFRLVVYYSADSWIAYCYGKAFKLHVRKFLHLSTARERQKVLQRSCPEYALDGLPAITATCRKPGCTCFGGKF